MSKLRAEYGKEIDLILAQYPPDQKKSAVLPLLHLGQRVYGYVSQEAKEDIASIIDVDPTHVMSIAGFYTLYHEKPMGKHIIEICNDLACALRGGDQLLDYACDKLGVANHGTTEDGMFSVENVMCIGACDHAPVMQVNLKFEEDVTFEDFDLLIEQLRSQTVTGQGPLSVVDRVIARRN